MASLATLFLELTFSPFWDPGWHFLVPAAEGFFLPLPASCIVLHWSWDEASPVLTSLDRTLPGSNTVNVVSMTRSLLPSLWAGNGASCQVRSLGLDVWIGAEAQPVLCSGYLVRVKEKDRVN